jgi:hypothetical protein
MTFVLASVIHATPRSSISMCVVATLDIGFPRSKSKHNVSRVVDQRRCCASDLAVFEIRFRSEYSESYQQLIFDRGVWV